MVKGLLVAAALFACVVPVLLVASPISYVPLIMVVCLVALSWAYLQVLKRNFSFSEEALARSCERGSNVRLSVTLRNGCALPHPYIDVSFCISDLFDGRDVVRHVTVALGAHEVQQFDFDAQFSHVGRYSAGIDSVVLHDMLGLFEARIDRTLCRQVVVRPRLFSFPGISISEINESAAAQVRAIASTDSVDYSSVREYRFGDPLKTVHWNLTSRSANHTMYTRLFEEFVSPSLSIVIDPFADFEGKEQLMSCFDGEVESAASLARFAQANGIDCSVRYMTSGGEYEQAHLTSVSDTEELVLASSRIFPVSDGRPQMMLPLEALHTQAASMQRVGNVAFVTARVSDEIVQLLSSLAANRISPLLVLCVPAGLAGDERARYLAPVRQLSARGIPFLVMESNEYETRGVAA